MRELSRAVQAAVTAAADAAGWARDRLHQDMFGELDPRRPRGVAGQERPMSETLARRRRALRAWPATWSPRPARDLGRLDPGAAAFGTDGPGALGELGR